MVVQLAGNILAAQLEDLGLSYRDLSRLCPIRPRLGTEVVCDILANRHAGTRRSWDCIVATLNMVVGAEIYTLEGLLGEPYERYLKHWRAE